MMGLTIALLYNLHHPQGLVSVLLGLELRDELEKLEKRSKEALSPVYSLSKPLLDFYLQCDSWRHHDNSFRLQIIKHLNRDIIYLQLGS